MRSLLVLVWGTPSTNPDVLPPRYRKLLKAREEATVARRSSPTPDILSETSSVQEIVMEAAIEESTPQSSVSVSAMQHSGLAQPFKFPTVVNPTQQPDGEASTSRVTSTPTVGEHGYYHGYPYGRPVLTREHMRSQSTRRVRSSYQ